MAASPHTVDSKKYKDALATRLYMGDEGGVLGALENHNCDVLVLPTDSDNPTDLAGYPSINVPLGFGPADISPEYATPDLVDRGPNVPYGLLFTAPKLHYLAPLPIYDDVKPYSLVVPLPPGQPRTNIQTRAYDGIAITNLRSCATEFNLDTAGFEFIEHKSSCDFSLKESVENQYLQESSDLLREKLGAESIYVFDYTVRN
ncbi:MAG: hypothetical protein Q9226_008506, partial [Calogaya cf. arnoldii]